MDPTNPNSSDACYSEPQDLLPNPKKSLDYASQEGDSEYLREGIRLIKQTCRKPKYPLSGFFLFSEEVKVTLKAQGKHSRSKAATQVIKEMWQQCPRQQDYHRLSSQHYQDYRKLLSYWKLLQSRKPSSTAAAGELETKPTARRPPKESLLKKRKLLCQERQGCAPQQCKHLCSAEPKRQDPPQLWISLPCSPTATPTTPIDEWDHTHGKVSSQKRRHFILPEPDPAAHLLRTPSRSIGRDRQATDASMCSELLQFEDIQRHNLQAKPIPAEAVAQDSIDRNLLRGFLIGKSPSEANPQVVASLRSQLAISFRDHSPCSILLSKLNPSCVVPGQPKEAQMLSFVPSRFQMPNPEIGQMAIVLPLPTPSLRR